jgi:hypothetical protein
MQIIVPSTEGIHNSNPATNDRLEKAKSYRDLSTIIISPIVGDLSPLVVQSWMGLIRPMNQRVYGPIFAQGFEVGVAYNEMIKHIIENPAFNDFKYLCTIEHDNIPSPDGLMKLYESIDDYDVVGGLYWTKGEEGQPMIYGNPKELPKNFIPQKPIPESVQPANGLGMGFNLYKLKMFRDMPYPWFKTLQEYNPNTGTRVYTQDLYFYEQAAIKGYKFACDTRVKVGHLDKSTGIIW